MSTIRITGKLILPNGKPAQFREVRFKRLPPDVTPVPGGGVLSDVVRAWTDINAEIDIDLVPGDYVGEVADKRGRINYNFEFTITGEEPNDEVTLEVLLSTSQFGDPVPYWFEAITGAVDEIRPLVDEANDAADRAEASATAAQSSVLADYIRTEVAQLPTTGVAVNSTAFVSGTGHFYHWNGAAWIDDGEGFLGDKVNISELDARVNSVESGSAITPLVSIGGDSVLIHDGAGIDFNPSERLRADIARGLVHTNTVGPATPLVAFGGDAVITHDGFGVDFKPAAALVARLSAEITPPPAPAPSVAGRETLARSRAKIAALRQGSPLSKLRVLLIGDSWVRLNQTRAGIVEVMTKDHPLVGEGWLSASLAYSTITGAVYTGSGGWTAVDGTGGDMPLGYTPDGQCLWTDQADQTLTWSNVTCTRFSIYVLEHGGTWRYRVDGGAWVAVEDDTSGALKRVQITGLSDVPHTFEIDTIGNSATVAIAGYYMARDGAVGVEISRFGDSGATAQSLHRYLEAQIAVIAQEPPDLIITVLGTNDARSSSSTPAVYVGYMADLLEGTRAVQPDVSAIHVISPNNAMPVVRPTTAYRDAIYAALPELGSAYLSLTEYWLPYDQANALGLWADEVHPSMRGGRVIADLLNDLLIWI